MLELPSVRQRVAPISVEAYHVFLNLGEAAQRTELLRGTIVGKMTKSPSHASVVRQLYEIISVEMKPGMIAQKEDPLTLADSEPEPDIAVVMGNPRDFRTEHPSRALLVIEVAERTEETDREKAAIYAEAGVNEYWLVLAERGVIEIFTQPVEGKYGDTRVLQRGDVAESRVLPNLRVELDALFS
ncbi:MAG: Uma2 family endonuclease [Opitutus sp.]|nr:Uma2 family endonuclease [Opitutus sp.]